MKFLKLPTDIRYVIAKLSNQQADLLRLLFIEDSLKIIKVL